MYFLSILCNFYSECNSNSMTLAIPAMFKHNKNIIFTPPALLLFPFSIFAYPDSCMTRLADFQHFQAFLRLRQMNKNYFIKGLSQDLIAVSYTEIERSDGKYSLPSISYFEKNLLGLKYFSCCVVIFVYDSCRPSEAFSLRSSLFPSLI